ncbi:MAG: 1,4-dihydroxy-2-naphthoate octaprenyltransferase [Archaeoglobus sp.]|nr:1,4-dihydroxy-2-naphthoate octaprenyltransferase [Archaeoglobus sp.]
MRVHEKLKIWVRELRVPFLTASIVPVILGTLVALIKTGEIDLFYFALTLVGVCLLHAATNVANDYFDYKSGTDNVNVEFITPFSGGSRVIQQGLMSPKEVLAEAIILFGLGALIGLYLTFARGITVLYLGIIGIVSGFFYTAPPFKFASKGIGELLVGLNFGVLVVLGSYYVQTQSLAIEPLLASLPVSFLITAVLWINEFPDYKADRETGKLTLVVRLGRRKAVSIYTLLMYIPYAAILVFILLGHLPLFFLIGLLTLPKAKAAVSIAKRFYEDPRNLAPANGLTIAIHLQTGILLSLAYALAFVNKVLGEIIPNYVILL